MPERAAPPHNCRCGVFGQYGFSAPNDTFGKTQRWFCASHRAEGETYLEGLLRGVK